MTTPFDTTLLSRVEDAGLNATAPPQQRWLDGWLVRTSPGKAKRARCVNAVAAGRMPLRQKLGLAEQAFRDAELPLVVRITPFTQPPELDEALAADGAVRFDETSVMVAELTAANTRLLPDASRITATDAQRYAEVVGALRGSTPVERAAHAERLAQSPVPYRGFVVADGSQVLGCGQYVREADLVGLYDIFTAPAARNRGVASALCSHLLGLAFAQGARTAYLQVEADNAPARAVYFRLGFRDAYTYHYRTFDGSLV